MRWRAVMRVLAALDAAAVEYVVIGAVALNFHGIVRATEHLDVFIAPDAANVGRLRAALHATYDDPSIDEIRAEDLCGDYPALRYDVDGQEVPVATPRTLFRMKRDTVRPIDHQDAARLAEAYQLEEDP